MTLSPSAHVDTFTRDSLPPVDRWPTLEFTIPDVRYPERLNAASELLDRTIDRFGAERPAILLADGAHWTYGELRRRVDQFAQVLTEDLGLVPGNRVLLRMLNGPWTVVCWLGALKAGMVVVTTMVAWRAREVRPIAQRVRPGVAVVDHRGVVEAEAAFADLGAPPVVLIAGGEDDALARACDAKSGVFTAVDTAADDVALLGATSGTTGVPKITMHFHRDILANADTFARHVLHLTSDDVSASTAPLAFTFGLGGNVVFPLRTGGSMVLVERATPVELARLIERLGITVLYTAPTGYRSVIKEGLADELRRLRIAVAAGEHLTTSTFEAVEAASGLRLINGIGATEMLHVFISASGDDIRPGTTGRAVPGYRATILDDEGRELGAGEPGRLAVIGPTGCRYLDDERQSVYVHDGWNITGDTFVRDEDGYFTFQARNDSMIVTAGYNVGAPEVEEVVLGHPDVRECAVVGCMDPERGMIVVAFVVPRDGVDPSEALTTSILDHVKSRLAIYKCPRRVDYLDELPRNPSGKVQHFILRERAAAEADVAPSHNRGA
ncbi:2-aminobenzoate-CoA ligase [Microbacterium phyllosphaerae]|uniref:2-aminobenzoate-CoA ligase n=1 Tax=Microbacterium phyllosphaerae TaxID=124798 RepID=A0ABS4WU25_9MICO|nr:AMP-binding protein [Microbacterium phyllosphaerae]MBP2379668.1 2-aminobenzoate-CoA ligase [Microbacterium phyllosphaerae]